MGKMDAPPPIENKQSVLVEVSPQQKTQDQKTHDFLIKAMQVSGFITVETGKNIVDTTKYKDFIVLTAKNSDVTFPDIFKSISSLECISKSDIKEDDSGGASPKNLITLPSSIESMTLGDFTPGYMDFAEVFPTTYERDFSIPLKNGEEVGARELKITKAIHDYSIKRVHGKLTYRDNVSGERKKLTLDQFTQLLGKRRDGRYFQVQDMHVAIPHLMKAGVVTPYDFSRQTGTEAANMFGRDEEFPKEGSTIKQISFTREGSNPALYYLGREKLLDTGIFFDPEKVSLAQLDGTTVAVVQVIHGEKRITHTFDLLSTAEIEPLVTQYIERYTAEHGHAPSKKDISARSFVGASIMKDRLKSYTVTDYLDFLPKDISTGMKEEVLKLTHNYDYMTKQLRLSLAETGVHMAQLPWKDQLIIGASLTMYGNEKEAKKFLKKYGDHGLKTFSSILRGGKEMGDKILLLGEKLPEDAARVLFGTYSKIVDASAEVADIVRENLGDKATPEMLQSIKEKLLVRGKNLLEENADKVSACEGVACEDIGTKLIEELELAKTSAYAFSEVCKLLVEKGEFSFEDFKDIELAYDRSPLPEKMKEEILTMHRENTKPYPDGLREHWRGTLREGLEKENEKQLVVSVKYKGDVIAVMRVIEQEDGSWYGASFNVNPTVKGSRIGTELLKKVIDDLAKDKPFVAHCYAENPMLDTYINKFGFVISNTQEDYHGTGATVHKITLSAT